MNLRLSAVAIFSLAIAILGVGCKGGYPIYNVENAPVPKISDKQVSLDDVGKAIARAGINIGWRMEHVKPGLIVGTFLIRGSSAMVQIQYTTSSYSIAYKDSTNYRYEDGEGGATIHKHYNASVKRLENRINLELQAL